MKKGLVRFCCVLLVAISCGSAYAAPKILLILKDGSDYMDLFLTKEVGVMMGMLQAAGFQPVVATKSGKLLKGAKNSLQPDLKLGDVELSDYVGVLVPCMGYGMHTGVADEGVALVKQAAESQMPVAAQNGGVEFLAKAGILKGRHFSIWWQYSYVGADGYYDGKGVSQDGLIVTSGTCPYRASFIDPDTTTELTSRFIKLLNSQTPGDG